MNATSYKFISAAILALLYVSVVAHLVQSERKTPVGGFIMLRGMTSYLVTFPVALTLEFAGHKIDFRSNWQMGAAIALCACLVFGCFFGAASLAEFIWLCATGASRPPR